MKARVLLVAKSSERRPPALIPEGARPHSRLLDESLATTHSRYLFHALRNFAYADPAVADACEISGWTLFDNNPIEKDLLGEMSGAMPVFSREEWHFQAALELSRLRPAVVGFSAYSWNVEDLLLVAHFLKQHRRDAAIIFGGPEVYGEKEGADFLRAHPQVDFVVGGEGEQAFRELLRFVVLGNGDLRQAPFTVYRDTSGALRSSNCQNLLARVDDIPSPILSQSPGELATWRSSRWGVFLTGSRGCPSGCGYCVFSGSLLIDTTVRAFSPERMLAELRHLKRAGVKLVTFGDSNLLIRREPGATILNFLLEDGETKVRFSQKLDMVQPWAEDLIRRLLASGQLEKIDVGIQTTNRVALKNVSRVNNLDKVLGTLRRIVPPVGQSTAHHALASRITFDLMAGLPGDDLAGLIESFDFLFDDLADVAQLPNLYCSLLSLLKGTALRARAEEAGVFFDPQPPYSVLETPTMPFSELRKARSVIWTLSVTTPIAYALLARGYHNKDFFKRFASEGLFAHIDALGWDNPLAHLFAANLRVRELVCEVVPPEHASCFAEATDLAFLRCALGLTDVPGDLSAYHRADLFNLPTLVRPASEATIGRRRFGLPGPLTSSRVFRFEHGREVLATARRLFDFHVPVASEIAADKGPLYVVADANGLRALSDVAFGLLTAMQERSTEWSKLLALDLPSELAPGAIDSLLGQLRQHGLVAQF